MGFGLLVLSVILNFCIFFRNSSNDGIYTKLRKAIILSLIANATIVYIFNEVSSAFNLLNVTTAYIFWSLEVLVLLGLLIYWNSKKKFEIKDLYLLLSAAKLKGLSKTNKLIIISVFLFYIFPLLFLAIYVPPNNYDSHNYHLNRVINWIFNGNLNHFPTLYIQQLYLNVLAEYIVLDTILLSGSDYFVGLVQFGAFIGSMAGVSLISKKIHLSSDGQLFALVFLLTLPIGIFESTTTQVDYIACFFFISFVYFGLEIMDKKSPITLLAFLLSLSLGGFAKYTIFIFGIPFTLYFAFNILSQYGFFYGFKVLLLAIILLVFLFTPLFQRNYRLFGDVMSPQKKSIFFAEKIPTDKHSLLFTISGVIKNASLHAGLPNNGFNLFIEKGIINFHRWLGVDINDPGLSLESFSVRFSIQEDMAPNTIHFWLIILAIILLFFLKRNNKINWLVLCGVIGFILFSSLLKYQLWSTRTHMPFFAIGSIVVAYIYNSILKQKVIYAVIPLMLLSSVFVFGNPNKPLLSIRYFTKKLFGHIPEPICFTDSLQLKSLVGNLSPYYDLSNSGGCHFLKVWPDYSSRIYIFNTLDQQGYYDKEKRSTIFNMDRILTYFLSHLDDYNDFKPLLNHIYGDHKNIGFLFNGRYGFYHYWAAISTKLRYPGMIQYIGYNDNFEILENSNIEFCYDYILSNDIKLIKDNIPRKNIFKLYRSNSLYLIELKNKSCDRVLFKQ